MDISGCAGTVSCLQDKPVDSDDQTAGNFESPEIPFGNGQWVPVKPEPERTLYWWDFPWQLNLKHSDNVSWVRPYDVWKLIAGKTTTHLPEECLIEMAPGLKSKVYPSRRVAPQVLDFGSQYESVLEFFTERMLGIQDDVPDEKQGLLNKMLQETGYKRD